MKNFDINNLIQLRNSYNGCMNTINYWFLKNYPDLCKEAESNSKFWQVKGKKLSLSQKLIFLSLNIHNYQHCPSCGSLTYNLPSWDKLERYKNNIEYLTLCKKCYYKSSLYQDMMKKMYLDKYGVDNPNKLQHVKNKVKQSLINHYGPEGLRSKEIHNKKIQTCLEKYGTEYSCQSKEIKDKIKKSFDEKYNGHPLRDQKIQEKFRNTCKEHFGTDHCMKNDHIKQKVKTTIQNRYGTDSVAKLDWVKDKYKKTCIERYGVDNPSKNKEIKEKIKQSSLKQYNTEYTFQSETVKEKIKQTLLERYGSDNPSKNLKIHKQQIVSIIKTKRKYSYEFVNKYSNIKILTPIEEYLTMDFNTHYLKWQCKICGNIFHSNNEMGIARCYNCHPFVPSKYQNEIIDYIKSLGITDIQMNDRAIIKPKELDIVIPSRKIAIEFNGLYWHSTQYILDKNRHLYKTKLANEKDYQLIQIFEDEYCFKKELVLNRISNILGFYTNIIFARKCEIKEVSFSDAKEFLNNNHLQGWVNSEYNYGLYYNDELVSLMTFGNYRIALGREKVENEYELLRFCCKLGYHIPGAASRLLTYFERTVQPKKLISYADRRWSKGNLYQSIGFSFVKFTDPNYSYVIGNHRENRFKWRKSQLKFLLEYFDPSLSEEENMAQNNYFRIYDCGNYLFEKKYN